MARGYNRGDAGVLCPYYIASMDRSIICEGGVDPKGKTETRFESREGQRTYMQKFCRRCYGGCPLVRANDKAQGFDRPERSGKKRA